MAINIYKELNLPKGRAICYSGFREGQQPGGIYPSYDEVKEDLLLLSKHWKYLRLFDCDQHASTVLDVIQKEKLDLKIMLGAYINAEMNNFNCPWNGGVYTEEQLENNKAENLRKVQQLIGMAQKNEQIIFALSVGNEACVEWTDHYVPESKVQQYVQLVKNKVKQPVSFCENYLPWLFKLENLAAAVDFISIHTYPVWEYKHISESLDYTIANYKAVAQKFPDKAIVITEAGWATNSNGRGINPENVNEEFQKIYFERLMEWADEQNILCFFFEAFDEYWKGSPEPLEPEKHWGLYKIDRSPKNAIKSLNQKK
ncbi:MAG: glycosyl hydrolase [Bacteroidetes bacterium]|jgi:exo-beta-1,3-glucanase (GH17 family)|nr:glycosyl hydrolase [Bacteroidota bacterium]